MMKKILVVLLSVVVVVLVADLVYIGKTLFFPKTQQPVTNNYDTENMVNVPTAYAPQQSAQAYMQQTDPYQTQAMPSQQIQQPADSANPTVSVVPTSVSGVGDTPMGTTSASVVQQPTGYTLEQTINAMQSAVAYVKSAQNFTGVKTQIPTMTLTYLSMPSIKAAAQEIINKFTETKTHTFVFTNGYATDPETNEPVTPAQAIPPDSAQFRIAPESVKSYDVKTDTAGNTIFTVVIAEEKCTLQAPVPYYHSMCMDYVNLNDYDISPAKINSGDITYHDATVSVTVNSAGIPIALREIMPVTGVGNGTLILVTADATLTGSLDEQWVFNW